MTIEAGTLRERVRIEQRYDADDGSGGQTVGWSFVADIWARVVVGSGGEAVDFGAMRASQNFQVTARFRDGVDPERHRLLWRGQPLNIQSVVPDETRESIQITAVSVVE